MYGDKEVCFVSVGYVSTCVQRYENICFASIDDSYVWAVVFYVFSEGECNIEVDVLLLRKRAYSTSVVTAVTWVDDKGESIFGGCL